MKTAGIVAEYNPFHLGHKYHIDETKRITDLPVTAVMSGNFVQRGECAMFDKSVRAEAALMNGCDLVLELPLPWALSSAERFARGAVSILNATGLCSVISFGSESGSTETITKAAETLLTLDDNKLKEYLSLGLSYPAARQKAAAQIMPEADSILSSPNDLLAVEYAKSIIATHSSAGPLAVKRVGAAHDSDITDGNSASASFIRNAARQNSDYSALIPENTISLYKNAPSADFSLLENSILSYLRRKTPEDFTSYPDVSEGLEYRIYDAVRTASSLDELYALIKTKRYTHSRIRRIILSAFLECNKNYTLSAEPAYIRVLGFTDKGRELLKQMKSTAALPIIMKHSDTYSLSPDAKAVYDLECLATDLYASAFSPLLPCGLEMKRKIIRL